MRDAVRDGGEVCRGKADKVGQTKLVGRSLVLRVEVGEVNLRGSKLGLREIHVAVDAGVGTAGDDGAQLLGARELFVERLLAGEVAIECKIGDDGILFNGSASVIETEDGGLQAETCGADVIPLRPAENGAGYLGVDDRWLPERVAVGPAEARAYGDGRDVDVLALFQDGGRLIEDGLGASDT